MSQDGFALMRQILETILNTDNVLPELKIPPNSCYTTKLLYLEFKFPSQEWEDQTFSIRSSLWRELVSQNCTYSRRMC